ncbi:MAG: hypothetical protein LUC93_05540, partial [Planctomycetaceae bacterium]|nr:hypothetical protein [Planctomycetaceae bacterium]
GLGRAINKDQEGLKETNPPTPFSRGSDSSLLLGSHEDRVRLVLHLWREAWRSAGAPVPDGVVGRNNRQGAERIATELLEEARVNLDQFRAGLKKLIARILTERGCANYDLRTLAKNPDKYLTAIPTVTRKKYVVWDYVCEVCGKSAAAPPEPLGECPPNPVPCVEAGSGCQGTMYPLHHTVLS